jgi:hypothetical protein
MDSKFFVEESTDFFKETNEYIELRKKFSGFMPWIDMIVSPLVTIITFFVYGNYDMFGFLSFGKALMVFREWLRYRHLSNSISKWREIVKKEGGPFISTNDPAYHVFVYADGMQRLHNSIFKTNCRVSRQNH